MTAEAQSKTGVAARRLRARLVGEALTRHVRTLREELDAVARAELAVGQPLELLQETSQLVKTLGEFSSMLMQGLSRKVADSVLAENHGYAEPAETRAFQAGDAAPSGVAQSRSSLGLQKVIIEDASPAFDRGLRALSKGEQIEDLGNDEALRFQRAHAVHALMLESASFCEQMGWTRQALSKAVKSHRVFFVEWDGARVFPRFFASNAWPRSQTQAVCKKLGELSGWEKWQFFTTPKGSLGTKTPLEALEAGGYAEVLDAAAGFATR